jgi:hypothetical protein
VLANYGGVQVDMLSGLITSVLLLLIATTCVSIAIAMTFILRILQGIAKKDGVNLSILPKMSKTSDSVVDDGKESEALNALSQLLSYDEKMGDRKL